MKTLSIIIPIYNSEKYISNCIESILNASIPQNEFEVIIINDGSTDNSPVIALDYVSKHDNFIYFAQENQGQSVARNKGIEISHGRYIWFVDSDDLICPDFNYIFNFLVNTPEVDIIKTVIKTYQEGETPHYKQLDGTYTHKSGRELLLENYHPSSVCNMIFRKSLAIDNNLCFIPNISGEDAEFSHRLYAYSNNVFTFNYITYLYLHNSNSSTQSMDYSKVLWRELSCIVVSKSFLNISKELSPVDTELSQLFYAKSGSVLLGLLFSMIKKKKERKNSDINHRILDKMKEEGVYPIKHTYKSIKKNIVKILLNNEKLLNHII